MSDSFVNKLMSKLDRLDSPGIHAYVLRLAREKGFLESVFNAIREGVVVLDSQRRIKYVNPAASEMLGLTGGCAGRKISAFLREIDWDSILGSAAGDRAAARQELEVFYPRRRLLSFYAVPHGSASGDVFTLMVSDVTAARASALQDIESHRVEAIATLAAGVAHEIGNPLNSLNIHLQLLDRELPPDPGSEARALLQVAKSEVERLDRVVARFLKAIRPEAPRIARLDPRAVVEDAVAFTRHELELKGVEIHTEWPDEVPPIMADPDQLRQALYNLIINAAQAMPGGGRVRVSCRCDDDFVRVSVADSGVGIPPEAISHVFEPYFTTKENGTGLGLMVVQRIARDNGADVTVRSPPGGGAEFTLSFPRRDRRVRLLEPVPAPKLLPPLADSGHASPAFRASPDAAEPPAPG